MHSLSGMELIPHLSSQPVSSKGIVRTAIYHGNNLCAAHAIGQLIYPTISYFSLFVAAEQEPNIAPEPLESVCVCVCAVFGHDRTGNCVGSS